MRPPPDLIDGENEYEVEAILNHRCHGKSRTLQYLIKWSRYSHADNTWEPADQVHALDLVKSYHHKHLELQVKRAWGQAPQTTPPGLSSH